ncbi:MAG: DUF2800 domain-containing protein [Hyphomicrobiales bacterium]|nr:DUF2800 domain-containing protein [Hyphomicrobiales bacterium]
MTGHKQRAHAALGASGAHRWMNCPGSVRMSAGIESRSSVYADEGTAAHMLIERCFDVGLSPFDLLGSVVDVNGDCAAARILKKGSPLVPGRFEITEEMAEAVQIFIDTVLAETAAEGGAVLEVESRVSLGEDMFGTADATVWLPKSKALKVFDFKYGAGVLVEVKDNPQLIYYGEGALMERVGMPISSLEIVIVQPRMPHDDGPVRRATVDPLTLLDWSLQFQEAAARTRDPDAPLVPGDWCRWCPAAGVCPALAEKALAVARQDFDRLDTLEITLPVPRHMTPKQVARAMDGFKLLEGWITSVREHAYDEARAGRCPPGWKLVDKRPTRQWADEERAERIAANMCVTRADMFTEPKLKSPAQIEKLVGKKDFAARLAPLAPPVSSGMTLAPEGDKRPAVLLIEDQFEALDDTISVHRKEKEPTP